MARDRWALSAYTKTEYAGLIKRMRDAGANIAPPEIGAEWIQVHDYPVGSAIRSWAHGTVFVLYIRVVGVAPKSVIRGFELSSPTWEFDPYILEDPADGSSPRDMYRMLDGSRYHRSEILNHRLGREGVLLRGNTIEGCVLAECMSAAPALYSRTAWAPLSLSIMNQFEEIQTISFGVPVERIRKRVQSWGSRESLFETQFPKSVDTAKSPSTGLFGEGAAGEAGRRNRDDLENP
jgi:hypothetical protein